MFPLHENPAASSYSPQIETTSWYAAYTASRHEKRVSEQLRERGLEHFLPVFETVHRWRNGRHRVQLPLFPGYVFVRIRAEERLRVLQIPGLVHLVSARGGPIAIRDSEIETIRGALQSGVMAEPYPYLKTGSRVEVCQGPFQGMRGILLRRRHSYRLVISLDLIMQSMVVEVDVSDVAPLRGPVSVPPPTYACVV